MKTILLFGLGIFFFAVSASAHPAFFADCNILERNHKGFDLDLNNGERLDFDAPAANSGPSVVTCKGDLGPGPAMTLNFLNTGEFCFLGNESAPLAKTKNWTEIIKKNGETTLKCDFGPRP